MTSTFDVRPRSYSSADYVTKAKRNRLVRLAVSAIFITKGGSFHSLAQVSRQVGCSTETVANVKHELLTMGLLGCIAADAPIAVHAAPEASFTNLENRLCDVIEWFNDLNEEGLADGIIKEATGAAHELLRVIRRKGSLPRHFPTISEQLWALENLCQLPKYDLTLTTA